MAKTGRPPLEGAKHRIITIRMDEEEYAKIVEYSQKSGKTMTQVCKEGLEKIYEQEPADP